MSPAYDILLSMRKALTLIALLVPLEIQADVTSPSGKTVECYCTDKTGARMELGQMTCLQVDGRMFMAQCQMSLNVPMWREIAPGCLSSKLSEPALYSRPVNSNI